MVLDGAAHLLEEEGQEVWSWVLGYCRGCRTGLAFGELIAFPLPAKGKFS